LVPLIFVKNSCMQRISGFVLLMSDTTSFRIVADGFSFTSLKRWALKLITRIACSCLVTSLSLVRKPICLVSKFQPKRMGIKVYSAYSGRRSNQYNTKPVLIIKIGRYPRTKKGRSQAVLGFMKDAA